MTFSGGLLGSINQNPQALWDCKDQSRSLQKHVGIWKSGHDFHGRDWSRSSAKPVEIFQMSQMRPYLASGRGAQKFERWRTPVLLRNKKESDNCKFSVQEKMITQTYERAYMKLLVIFLCAVILVWWDSISCCWGAWAQMRISAWTWDERS